MGTPIEERRKCFYVVDEEEYGAELVVVVEGIEGYYPRAVYATSKDMLARTAHNANVNLGLTDEDVEQIVQSSMFPNSVAANLARERYGD